MTWELLIQDTNDDSQASDERSEDLAPVLSHAEEWLHVVTSDLWEAHTW